MTEEARDKVFISYSHEDGEWLDKLKVRLEPLIKGKEIIIWDDRGIHTGEQWEAEITKALKTAAVGVLLVSGNFLDSEYIIKNELPTILNASQAGECRLCWLLIDKCDYKKHGLHKYQAAQNRYPQFVPFGPPWSRSGSRGPGPF